MLKNEPKMTHFCRFCGTKSRKKFLIFSEASEIRKTTTVVGVGFLDQVLVKNLHWVFIFQHLLGLSGDTLGPGEKSPSGDSGSSSERTWSRSGNSAPVRPDPRNGVKLVTHASHDLAIFWNGRTGAEFQNWVQEMAVDTKLRALAFATPGARLGSLGSWRDFLETRKNFSRSRANCVP